MSKGEMSLEVTYVLPLVYEWNSQSPEKLYGLTKVAQSDCTAKKKKKKKNIKQKQPCNKFNKDFLKNRIICHDQVGFIPKMLRFIPGMHNLIQCHKPH